MLGIMSAVSAIVQIGTIGLRGFMFDLLETYRLAMKPIYSLVELIDFPFQVPIYTIDLFTLYLVMFSMSLRAAVWPLFNNEVLSNQREVDSIKVVEIFPEKPKKQDLPVSMVGWTREDGYWEQHSRRQRSVRYSYIKAISLSTILWPVFSLLPMRRVKWWKFILRFDLNVSENFAEYGDKDSAERGSMTISLWRVTWKYFELFLEMLLVPFGVLLFFVLNTYPIF